MRSLLTAFLKKEILGYMYGVFLLSLEDLLSSRERSWVMALYGRLDSIAMGGIEVIEIYLFNYCIRLVFNYGCVI